MDWNVPHDHIAGRVCDNRANMVHDVSLIGWPHIPCFGCTLRLCVEVGLNLAVVIKLSDTVGKHVDHFKHSSLAWKPSREAEDPQYPRVTHSFRMLELTEVHIFHARVTTQTVLDHLLCAA